MACRAAYPYVSRGPRPRTRRGPLRQSAWAGPRTTIVSTTPAPTRSARRAVIVRVMSRSCVAHAEDSATSTSSPSCSDVGRQWSAISGPTRRSQLASTLAAAVVLLALAVLLLLNGPAVWRSFFPPDARSVQGQHIRNLYDIVFVIAAVIFFVVEGLIVWTVVRYRRKPGDDDLPPQTHGNNLAEIIWTIVPTVIVIFLFVISWQTLNTVEAVKAALESGYLSGLITDEHTARAIGEFGAVSVISGRVAGETQTLTILVEQRYNNFDISGAYAASALLALIALVTLLGMTALSSRREIS